MLHIPELGKQPQGPIIKEKVPIFEREVAPHQVLQTYSHNVSPILQPVRVPKVEFQEQSEQRAVKKETYSIQVINEEESSPSA